VRSGRRWQPLAFALAAGGGSLVAFLIDRPRSTVTTEESQAQAVRESVKSWSDTTTADAQGGEGPRLERAASSAVLPPERLRIRVGLPQTIAAGNVWNRCSPAAACGSKAISMPPSRKLLPRRAPWRRRGSSCLGRPAAVDALLHALAASAAVLALEGEEVFVEVAAEPSSGTSRFARCTAGRSPPEPPARVRLVIEIAEVVPEAAPWSALRPLDPVIGGRGRPRRGHDPVPGKRPVGRRDAAGA